MNQHRRPTLSLGALAASTLVLFASLATRAHAECGVQHEAKMKELLQRAESQRAWARDPKNKDRPSAEILAKATATRATVAEVLAKAHALSEPSLCTQAGGSGAVDAVKRDLPKAIVVCRTAFDAARTAQDAMQAHRSQVGDRTDAQATAVKKLYAEVEDASSGIHGIDESCTRMERVLSFLKR